MAEFPKGHKALAAAGYIYRKDGICQHPECKALLHWYTTPNDKFIPIDSITMEPHWKTCIGADSFRKKKKEPPADPQQNLFEPKPMREPGED